MLLQCPARPGIAGTFMSQLTWISQVLCHYTNELRPHGYLFDSSVFHFKVANTADPRCLNHPADFSTVLPIESDAVVLNAKLALGSEAKDVFCPYSGSLYDQVEQIKHRDGPYFHVFVFSFVQPTEREILQCGQKPKTVKNSSFFSLFFARVFCQPFDYVVDLL